MKSKIHEFINLKKTKVMSKNIIIGISLLILGANSAKVNAQNYYTPGIRHEQVCQQERIYNGVRTGEITPRELARLEMQQARIQHDKRCAKADGYVSPCDRYRLRREQAYASYNIYRDKHNGFYRF